MFVLVTVKRRADRCGNHGKLLFRASISRVLCRGSSEARKKLNFETGQTLNPSEGRSGYMLNVNCQFNKYFLTDFGKNRQTTSTLAMRCLPA